MNLSSEQFEIKKKSVIDLFKPELVEQCRYDPAFVHIIKLLAQDADPIEVISALLTQRFELIENFKQVCIQIDIPPIAWLNKLDKDKWVCRCGKQL